MTVCVATRPLNESSLARRPLKWLQLCFYRNHVAVAVFIVLELSVRQEVTPLTPREAPAVSDANDEEATPRREADGESESEREREREKWLK